MQFNILSETITSSVKYHITNCRAEKKSDAFGNGEKPPR